MNPLLFAAVDAALKADASACRKWAADSLINERARAVFKRRGQRMGELRRWWRSTWGGE